MHELSIAQRVCEVALENLDEHPNCNVKRIAMRIGKLSDVVPEALEFGFDAIREGTALAQTELSIERVDVTGQCKSCKKIFTVEDFAFICPECESIQISVLAGEELEISFLELDDSAVHCTENTQETMVRNGKN